MKPYISTHENNDGDTVLVYIDEVSIDDENKPECIVIKSDHLKLVIEELQQQLRSL